jgi:hypothetical protein
MHFVGGTKVPHAATTLFNFTYVEINMGCLILDRRGISNIRLLESILA